MEDWVTLNFGKQYLIFFSSAWSKYCKPWGLLCKPRLSLSPF